MKNYISERLNHIEPSKTVELTTKIARLREEGQHIIGLNVGEPDFATPEHISEDRMETWLHRSGKRYCKSSKCNAEPDGFHTFIRCRRKRELQHSEEAHVAVVPGSAFLAPRHLRFTYSASMEELKNAMNGIENALKNLGTA